MHACVRTYAWAGVPRECRAAPGRTGTDARWVRTGQVRSGKVCAHAAAVVPRHAAPLQLTVRSGVCMHARAARWAG